MNDVREVQGIVDPAFAAVQDAFIGNFKEHNEVGAAFAVVSNGRLVVDLHGGHADGAKTKPWTPETVTNVWSTTKGIAALCFAMLIDRGQASYEDPVSRYWPEFAREGKANISIAQVLSHQAGLCGFTVPMTMQDILDQESAEQLLAHQAPLWSPGTRSGYHAVTYGTLANALFRRIDGRTLARFVAEELNGPFQLGLSIGLPQNRAYLASEILAPAALDSTDVTGDITPIQTAALANPVLSPTDANLEYWRAAPLPSVNGFATARGLARLYSALATDGRMDGEQLLSTATIRAASASRSDSVDLVLDFRTHWAAGFLRNTHNVYGDSTEAFGHSGWGGSFAFADPSRGVAVSYVMNSMGQNLIGDARGLTLIEATLRSIDKG